MDGGSINASDNSINVTRRAAGVPHGITPSRRQGHRANSHSVTVGTSSAYSIYLRQHPHTSPIPHPPHPLPKVSLFPPPPSFPPLVPHHPHIPPHRTSPPIAHSSTRAGLPRTARWRPPHADLHAGHWIMGASCWVLDVGCSMLDARSVVSFQDRRSPGEDDVAPDIEGE